MNDWGWLLLVGAFWAMGAFLSLAAYSLRDFSRSRLEEICLRRGKVKRFGSILKRYENALIAVEMLQMLAFVALIALSVQWWNSSISRAAVTITAISEVTGVLLFVLFILLTTLLLPWTIARVAGEPFLFRSWPLLSLAASGLRPAISVARRVDTYAHRLTGLDEPDPTDSAALAEEIRSVVDEGQREGVLESEARTMIHRVIELQEESVTAIMTPRTEMITIPAAASFDEARREFLKCGHSRIPVVGESTDDITGVLYAKDLLLHVHNGADAPPSLRELVREPLYVPETTGIDTLLQTMKRERVHFALVLDEYGGVAGLVTMEDILEEIVGEIGDEYDSAEEAGILVLQPGSLEVSSWVRIDELNERFEYDLPEDDDFDTIGGFVFAQMGRIPKPNDSLEWQNLRFTVLTADKRKIDKLRIDVDESRSMEGAEAG